jgi:hypothetical protein
MGLVFISASFNITLIVLLTLIIAMCLVYIYVTERSNKPPSKNCRCNKPPSKNCGCNKPPYNRANYYFK